MTALFLILALLIAAGCIAGSKAARTAGSKAGSTAARISAIPAACITAAGIVLLIAAAVTASRAVSAAASDTALAEWASDALGLWIRTAGIGTALIAGSVLLAALLRHRWVRVRNIVAAAGAWLLLLCGRAYIPMCVSESVDLTTPLVLFTVGFACLHLAGPAVDLARAARRRDR